MDVIDDLSETLAPAAALMLMSLSWLAISGRIPGLRDWSLDALLLLPSGSCHVFSS
jgi:hypothetical protein